MYLSAQILGSALAAFVLTLVFPADVVSAAGLGTPVPAPNVTFALVVLVEAVLTFLLMFAVWGTAVDPRAPKIGGFGIGLVVLFDILVGGPITGAGMNPARVMGPAIVGNVWSMHAAYWIGPIVGALVGLVPVQGVSRSAHLSRPPAPADTAARRPQRIAPSLPSRRRRIPV